METVSLVPSRRELWLENRGMTLFQKSTATMLRLSLSSTLLVVVAAMPLRAQVSPDTAGFVVLHGTDTVAVEQFTRTAEELSGRLVQLSGAGGRTIYRAATLPDASAPLIEVSVWKGTDPESSPARQRSRLIFKDDSVAIDDVSQMGITSVIMATQRGALPYMNFSFAFLEQATRRAGAAAQDSVMVPFFNLGGGQTLDGSVIRLSADSEAVRIGKVEFRLQVDPKGRILGGGIPAQGLKVNRTR
jgi:hypothetical protein